MPRMYCSHRLIVLPLDVPTLTTSRLRDPSNQRWNYIHKPLFYSNFHTSHLLEILAARGGTTSHHLEILAARGETNVGEKWPMNFAWNARLPRNIQGSFTCHKSTTWDQQLYFPSELSRAEDFFALKNPTASARFEPPNLGTKGQHATPRPLKPHSSPTVLRYVMTANVVPIKWNFYTRESKQLRSMLRPLVDGASRQRAESYPRTVHVGFVVHKVTVGPAFLQVL
jgi:hypothetical protein